VHKKQNNYPAIIPSKFWKILFLLGIGVSNFSVMAKDGSDAKALPRKKWIVKLDNQQQSIVSDDILKVAKLLSSEKLQWMERDQFMHHTGNGLPQGMPNDPLYYNQWHYNDTLAGIKLSSAWSQIPGSTAVKVAVLDTGILAHPDLDSNVLPGMDFVSDSRMGADGDGRDNDPTDVGDSVASGDFCYAGQVQNSSWHGTHVAGTISAVANNGQGVVGVNPGAKVLPVRVLGKCGGYTSDIVDGMRWAAGLSVAGVGANSNPVKVINLSLGSPGACTRSFQQAINDVRAKGVLVVVAAGNSGANIDATPFAPASCKGVVTIGAHNAQGSKSYYSNYGKRIDVMAPGGDSWQGVLSTSNMGLRTAESASYRSMSGTSMATPHVAGIISLMFSVNPGLVPSQVIDILKDSANSMPILTGCENGSCGAGMVDASEAVYLALRTDSTGAVDNYTPTLPNEGGAQRFTTSSSDGGGCGSIALLNNKNDQTGQGPYALSLALGILISFVFLKGFSLRKSIA